jgi:multidrug efflux pump subunit AcrA (membrane-fusion protein)
MSCPLLGGPTGGGTGNGSEGGPASGSVGTAVNITCALPTDIRLFPGLAAIMAVTTAETHGVVAVALEAVAGTADRGTVSVRSASGQFEQREVRLGITDGSYIQITSGLAVGDLVGVPAPALPSSRQR